MKKIIFSFLALTMVSFGFAQVEGEEGTVELEGVTVSPVNLAYQYAVIDPEMPPSVQNLQKEVARYDVTEMPTYNGRFEAYEVIFEQFNGSIIATYDGDGKIMNSFERFKDITLPLKVRQHIAKENPGWLIHKDVYMVSYYDDKELKKICKVKLLKDGQKRSLKFDLEKFDQSMN